MPTGITVEQVLKRKPILVKPSDTVANVAKKLSKAKVSSAIVVKKDDILGIVTDRDILNKVVAPGKNPKEVKVEDIMTPKPFTIEYDEDIEDATQLMVEKGIRRVVVTKLGRPIGFLMAVDLLAAISSLNSEEEFEEESEEPEFYGYCEVCGQYKPLERIIHEGREMWVCESCKDMLREGQ
ncbi:CBS domain-containing protein [Palaeococcus sp. (in: euryarchaeotes)]|uniref:CBS domain-containing protein n=1 Tax=Palaeococcus sp. (in: euryarchaeotes) TaxID=2820298 RepID=UPI000F13B982|nr:CBS domain-containing protein [Palaeococcus sp. (in: euryarchaeotes)]MCD6558571.1 CBS domain-containing protein [Palaeococcus sp. (in: euryarchaeotes)]RLF75889.1 MAG: CBS domain-containing protein [Thermococci archaeon]